MKRQIYLAMKSLSEARSIFFSRFGPQSRTPAEEINTEDALGRVTAEPVFSKFSAPSYHSAAMDGIAVRAEETYGTSEKHPRVLTLGKDAIWINTGQPLAKGFDSVIMVEKLHQVDDSSFEIRHSTYPWQHVRKVGEDIVATQLLLPQNHVIRPYDLGALISAGIFRVSVWQKPKVVIIPTGSELVHHHGLMQERRTLKEGQIIEYNSLVLAGLVRECGGVAITYDIIPDSESELRPMLQRAIESDAHVIMVNAGSSAGSRDYTVHMIREMGEVLVHGVAMMPGKPTILGVIAGKPVIGNPGYPVSSTLSFDQFVRPLLFCLQGRSPERRKRLKVQPTRNIPSKPGIEEFLRVNIGKVGDHHVATPLPRAAGSITTLTRAEGLIRIPASSEGISQDEQVEAELLVDEEEIANTLVFIGSHDISIDILADEIRRLGNNIRISSGNVGSLGGLIALRKGTCHLAGAHLLDIDSGEYNLSYIRKYLKGMSVSVFHLVLRDQGLIVARGNPKRIAGMKDLAREDVTFVNRQPGSGTRILLDHKLLQLGIPANAIKGYAHEEFTHLGVAIDILSGAADCGLGVFAAAKALNLDFLPIEKEQYDLIIPTTFTSHPSIKILLESIRSPHFRNRILELGGYDPSQSGMLWVELHGGSTP